MENLLCVWQLNFIQYTIFKNMTIDNLKNVQTMILVHSFSKNLYYGFWEKEE